MKNNYYEKSEMCSFDKRHKSLITFQKPEKYKDIENFSKNSKNLITFGSTYSYSPIFFDHKSTCLDLSKFNKILYFNSKKKVITVEAGIKIFELLNFTLKHKLWLAQLPGYPYISIGGAVATNIHGKSSGVDGTIKNSIKHLLIFHKKHGWINLSKNKNKEIFDLTIGGLGLTGTIVSVTLELKKFNFSNFLTTKYEVKSISETITILKKYKKKNLLVYSWNDASTFDNLGRGFVYVSKPINKLKKKILELKFKKKPKLLFPLWNKWTSIIFNAIFFKLQKFKKKKIIENFEKTIFPFAGNENYFHLYGKKGFIESQLIIPLGVIDDFFRELKKYYKIFKPEIILFSFKNMNGKQKFLRFEGEGICVTLDFTNKNKNLKFLNKIDFLCIKYGVTPSLIKDSRISKKIFNKCFSESNLFRKKLYKFDNKRVYQSELSRKLKI